MSDHASIQAAFPAPGTQLLCCQYAAVILNRVDSDGSGGAESRSIYYWALGVLDDGRPEAVGVWPWDASTSRGLCRALQEMAGRGAERIRFLIGGSESSFPEEIRDCCPGVTSVPSYTQQVERSLSTVSSNDLEPMARQLRQVMSAAFTRDAHDELESLGSSPMGKRYPDVVAAWRLTLEQGRPLFDASPPLRRAVLSGDGLAAALNRSLGRAIARRRPFTSADDAVAFVRAALERRLRAIGGSDSGAATARGRTRTALATTMSASL